MSNTLTFFVYGKGIEKYRKRFLTIIFPTIINIIKFELHQLILRHYFQIGYGK